MTAAHDQALKLAGVVVGVPGGGGKPGVNQDGVKAVSSALGPPYSERTGSWNDARYGS